MVLWPPPWRRPSVGGRLAAAVYVLAIAPVVVAASSLAFLSIPIQRCFAKRRGPLMTASEVALVIDRFVSGQSGGWEWDDFISIRIGDTRLNAIRSRCAQLPEEFPPARAGWYCGEEGLEVMRQFVRELRRLDG